jgi:C1A family cysteine protease
MKNKIFLSILLIASVILFIFLLSEILAAPNPAALYCNKLKEDFGGYNYLVVKTFYGERGFCIMPNGQQFDEWDFFTGKVGQEYSYCIREGYGIRTIRGGKFASEGAVCLVPRNEKFLFLEIPIGMQEIDVADVAGLDISEQEINVPTQKMQQATNFNLENDNVNYSFSYWNWLDPPQSKWSKDNYVFFDDVSGWLSPVKNQGTCKSCWAFGTLGAIESKYTIEKEDSRLDPDLSEQYFVSDCCPECGDCAGGSRYASFNYTMYHGISDELCFPYIGQNSDCSPCPDYGSRLWNINNYFIENFLSNEQLEQRIINYPVSVILDWDGSFDEDCVYRCGSSGSMTHIIVLAGYNDTGNLSSSYWIAKNSFGLGWPGICNVSDGYFKLGFNECNLGTIIYPEHVNPPNFKPSIVLNSPFQGYISNNSNVGFNFTVYTQVSRAICDLIVDGVVRNMASINNATPSTFFSSLEAGQHNWSIRCWEEGFGITSNSETRILIMDVPDLSAPKYFDESKNNSLAGEETRFQITWQDNQALQPEGQYIFSFDNCQGIWVNSSANFISNPEQINIFRTLNDSANCTVRYRWYAKDNASNWNSTRIYSFLTTFIDEPPRVLLIQPKDEFNSDQENVTFRCNSFDDKKIQSLTLYNNASGWNPVFSNTSCTINCSLVYTMSLINNIYEWNCLTLDNTGNLAWAKNNFSLTVSSSSSNTGTSHVCQELSKKCLGNLLQQCQGNAWNDIETCEHGCDTSTLNCIQIICQQGSRRCSNNLLQECRNNAWVLVQECNYCDIISFECRNCVEQDKKCSINGNLLVCQQNSWQEQKCENGCQDNNCILENVGEQQVSVKNNLIWIFMPFALVILVLVVILILFLIKITNIKRIVASSEKVFVKQVKDEASKI